jgi:hypothetical protein
MRTAALFVIGLVLGTFAFAQQPVLVQVEGVAIDAATERPLSGVSVQIADLRVTTSAEGQFALSILPGRYILNADKVGYMRARADGRKSGASGIELTLAAHATPTNLTLRMFRTGSVSGRVYDTTGKALQNALVVPYRSTYDSAGLPIIQRLVLSTSSIVSTNEIRGELALLRSVNLPSTAGYDRASNIVNGRTDDRGEFHIGNLEPGKYAFYAVPMTNSGTLTPAFYPGVTKAADAELVEIESGLEVQLRNITLRTGTPANLRVRMSNLTGETYPTGFVLIHHRGQAESVANSFRTLPCTEEPANTACSTAELRLLPGSYDVEGVLHGASSVASARMPLEMSGADMRMDIVIPGGGTVTGRATAIRSGSPPAGMSGFQVQFSSPLLVPGIPFPVVTGTDGVFRPITIPAGLFRVNSVSGIPPGLCLAELLNGSVDVRRHGLQVSAGSLELTANLREAEASVKGVVADNSGKKISGAFVALIPEDLSQAEVYATGTTDQNGAFDLACVRAGSYRLYAWSEMEGAAYRNRDFMKQYAEAGHPLRVVPGSNSTDVKVLGEDRRP